VGVASENRILVILTAGKDRRAKRSAAQPPLESAARTGFAGGSFASLQDDENRGYFRRVTINDRRKRLAKRTARPDIGCVFHGPLHVLSMGGSMTGYWERRD
jgi:hypothetical protein